MTVYEIVTNYLKENGFDGLFCDGCGCGVNDDPFCSALGLDCEPGYEHISRETCPPDCEQSCFDVADADESVVCTRPVYKVVQNEN